MGPSDNKRQAILNATLDLLVERDLQSTSMSLVAKEANVGMGTIYNYFAGKEALVSALFNQVNRNMLEFTFEDYPEAGSVRERFCHIWRQKCRFFIANPKMFIFVERFVDSPYIRPELDEGSRRSVSRVETMFSEARQEGLLKDLPREFFLPLVNGALVALIRGHVTGAFKLDAAAIEMALDACWDAVKA